MVELVGEITALSIVIVIALFVILYLVAGWKFKKAMKDQDPESRSEK